MFTLQINEHSGEPIYEQLYLSIRQNITDGKIKCGEKLPSKRKLAVHLNLSVNTVASAYAQLLDEGYIESVEKRGYYALQTDLPNTLSESAPFSALTNQVLTETQKYDYDLTTNAVDSANFPFSIWAKLMRECLRDEQYSLLISGHPQGDLLLRQEISNYLSNCRNVSVPPEQIVLGAGAEYLLGLIIELLSGSIFALENPCYAKLAGIFANKGIGFVTIPVDAEGINVEMLRKSCASIIYTTPAKHFPLGTIMSATRRNQLAIWAEQATGRYIIEDDYDSEYRYRLRQIPALCSTNRSEKIIYLNTFTRTLAPSLRIAYMILPQSLLCEYHRRFGSSACVVSSFEQSTLRRFLAQGYYERHINRMRKIYRERRDAFVNALSVLSDQIKISADEAGLHLLISSRSGLSEKQMIEAAGEVGVKVYALSDCYIGEYEETHTVMAGFGGLNKESLIEAATLLCKAWNLANTISANENV